ncbi:D-alanyl-lipoteichoic acid acyltransferase DltB, MBOAT superfamily [Maribacter dokdonensis]|uniref:D-alanyl-lipoteichoic acid acyltransferase DltB, MBOAT superfamily n=1 Tax=Maribacter dokdonensis TaxID=320912 RepID=A0ABY0UID6_9FLAO|nr:MBOAT family O-acyltransferase [Maribacter dokdonensis]SDS73164.1 D-alanyl-lipoteichoic acid acyltransferase DltB, MBOAT superfamily [Maribacter dokdonensis]
MLFNTIEFFIFLPTVFVLYWFVFPKNLKYQNLLVLVSSYVFYGWWDYRFLSLIFLSTVIDYFIALEMEKSDKERKRKQLLGASMVFNLGMLGFFKYYNFFVDSWVYAFQTAGFEMEHTWTLQIVLPVGISFYTFQTMSYTIDVYRKNLRPTKDFISFASFVSFFPQLVAGPIERATNLLPQILKKRTFSYEKGVQGLRLILWGLFKKVVIADSLAPLVNDIFENYGAYDGGTLLLGAIYFAFQIYCDFSGYSDIAIGVSKLFGFELMSNFKFPYFSRNIGEFWRRWHISLSTWFRDYLYIPLGGSRNGKWASLKNIFIIFIVSGFWHGANWTFMIWGLIHALLYIPSFIFNTNRKYLSYGVAENKVLPTLKEIFQMGTTFFCVTIAWVFFRSNSLGDALSYISKLFLDFMMPQSKLQGIGYVIILMTLEWGLRNDERLTVISKYVIVRLLFYMFIAFQVLRFFGVVQTDFIYFQF